MRHKIYKNKKYSIVVCVWLLHLIFTSSLSAAPSAFDLLEACEISLKNGFQGIEGELCTWYITPCDCDYGKTKETPRVCLPEPVPVESLARIVVRGLKEQPELHMEDANYAAAIILSHVYPCSE
jgi:hypothetical protein